MVSDDFETHYSHFKGLPPEVREEILVTYVQEFVATKSDTRRAAFKKKLNDLFKRRYRKYDESATRVRQFMNRNRYMVFSVANTQNLLPKNTSRQQFHAMVKRLKNNGWEIKEWHNRYKGHVPQGEKVYYIEGFKPELLFGLAPFNLTTNGEEAAKFIHDVYEQNRSGGAHYTFQVRSMLNEYPELFPNKENIDWFISTHLRPLFRATHEVFGDFVQPWE